MFTKKTLSILSSIMKLYPMLAKESDLDLILYGQNKCTSIVFLGTPRQSSCCKLKAYDSTQGAFPTSYNILPNTAKLTKIFEQMMFPTTRCYMYGWEGVITAAS